VPGASLHSSPSRGKDGLVDLVLWQQLASLPISHKENCIKLRFTYQEGDDGSTTSREQYPCWLQIKTAATVLLLVCTMMLYSGNNVQRSFFSREKQNLLPWLHINENMCYEAWIN